MAPPWPAPPLSAPCRSPRPGFRPDHQWTTLQPLLALHQPPPASKPAQSWSQSRRAWRPRARQVALGGSHGSDGESAPFRVRSQHCQRMDFPPCGLPLDESLPFCLRSRVASSSSFKQNPTKNQNASRNLGLRDGTVDLARQFFFEFQFCFFQLLLKAQPKCAAHYSCQRRGARWPLPQRPPCVGVDPP